MRSLVALLLALLLVLAVGLAVWGSPGSEPLADAGTPPEDAVRGAPTAAGPVDIPDPGEVAERREAAAAAEAAVDDAEAGAEAVVIEVLDCSDQPAAAVEVRWLPTSDPRLVGARADGTLAVLVATGRLGHRATTGPEGRVRLRWTAEPLSVIARGLGTWAAGELPDDGTRRLTLRLQADDRLAVRVVTGDGAPCAGARVGVVVASGRRVRIEWAAFTDGTGRVVAPHLQHLRPGTDPLHLGLLVPLSLPVAVPLPPAGSGEVTLTMPATARLRVALSVADGSPALAAGSIGITHRRNSADVARPPAASVLALPSDTWVRKAPGSREVVLPFVGQGVELAVHGSLEVDGALATGTLLAVPAQGDCELAPRLEPGRAVWRGRVLRGGEPFAGELTVRLLPDRSRGSRSPRVTTDASGRFELHVRPVQSGADVALRLLALAADGDAAGWEARTTVSSVHGDSVRDLGDLELTAPAELARLQILDDRDAGIAGALVSVLKSQVDPRRGTVRWRADPGVLVREVGDGRYSLQGEVDGEERRLSVSARGHLRPAGEVILVPGADHRIVLMREGSISGTLVQPGWLEQGTLDLELFRHGETRRVEHLGPEDLRTARFRFRGLAAGSYRVRVGLATTEATLLEESGLLVAPGQDVTLPELDLRFRLHLMRVFFQGARGQELRAPGILRFRLPDGRLQSVTFGRPPVTLTTVAGVVELEVEADGYRPETLAAVPGDQYVTLRPGPRLRVEWPAEYPDLEAFQPQLRVHFVRTDGGAGRALSLRSDPPWDLHVAQPGSYRLELTLRGRGPRLGVRMADAIAVRDVQEVQTFRFVADQQDLQPLRGR